MSNLEITRRQIEKTALHLASLFKLMQTASQKTDGEFSYTIETTCEIGYELADSILAASAALTNE